MSIGSHPAPWLTIQAPRLAAVPNIELHVIGVTKMLKSDEHFVEDGIYFHFLSLPRVPRALLFYQIDRRRIHSCLRNIEPDLVHGFGTESSYSYAAVSSPFQSLLMIQGIQSEIVRALGSARWRSPQLFVPMALERWTVRRCKDFICEANFAAEFVRRLNPVANIHMLRTPVRSEFFSLQRDWPPAEAPVLIFVGSVIPEKGIEVLLHAFAEVLKDFPEAHLRVIGHYALGYAPVLQSILTRLGIESRVSLHGYLEIADVVQQFAAATLLVLPSFMDTAPNVIAEAQVAGVPVVATSVGGIPEMIEPDVTGVLVEPRSAASLRDGILRLLKDPVLATSVATAGRVRAREICAPEMQVAKLVEVYRTIHAQQNEEHATLA